MTLHVKVGEAKAHFSRLLSQVEAGEEVIIKRGNRPVAKLVTVDEPERTVEVIEGLRRLRKRRAGERRVTIEEILAWRHDGHRF